MHPRPYQNRQHQRGFTLMEILVAVAIFVTVMIVALLLYDRSNRVFKESNEAAEMQQNTRVAFEKLVGDLRMAGFDYKRAGTPTATTPAPWVADRTYSTGTMVTPTTPNGHVYRCINAGTSHATKEPTWTDGNGDIVLDLDPLKWQEGGAPIYEQPDEQIEYAHSAAVTIRANFDYDEPGTENGRESALENGNFPVVTTGNDEIVTYALVSRTGKNEDDITFYADVNDGGSPARTAYPGGDDERAITINGVDLSNANPPYTLMRYSLDDKGAVVATALADNIRSMNFLYWEDAQATRALTDLNNDPISDVGGDGAYDPDTPGALVKERLIRGKVRAVTVNIVGMNPQPDYAYTNPDETLAGAKNYRQYTLMSTVVGRNLGLEGVPQSSSTPPGPPTWDTICNGYCGITVLSWKPDETTGGDVSYTLYYDKSPMGSFSGILPAGSQTTYAVDLTQKLTDGTTYYFKVGATNEYGTTLSKTYATVDVRNATKMDPPTVAVAATGKPNELAVSWALPLDNASGTASCTAGSPPDKLYTAEVRGYRVYRSLVAGFTPGGADSITLMDETTGGATTDGSGTWTFIDKTVASCEKYYYRVEIVEWCAAKDEYNTTSDLKTGLSDAATEKSNETIPLANPKTPVNLKVDPTSSCDPDTNFCYPVILNWDKVTKDLSGNDIVILDYEITRKKKLLGDVKETAVFDISDGANTFSESGKLEYTDVDTGEKFSYEYSIVAKHEDGGSAPCNKESAAATISFPDSCSTGATVKADSSGGDGSSDSPWTDVSALQVYEGLKPITAVEVSLDGGTFAALTSPYLYPYDDLEDGEVHNVSFKITVAGCTETIVVYIQNDAPTCLLTGTVSNNTSTSTVLDINLVSSATEIITIQRIDVTWAAQTGLAWNSSTLPSNDVHNAAGSPAVARTEQITPTGADTTIAANGSYKVRLNMAGTPIPLGFQVTGVTVRYTVPSTGPSVVHNCPITPLTRCSVTALANFGGNFLVNVPITNASTEQLTLSTFSIAWAGQDKLRWGSIDLPTGANLGVTTATISGIESFTAPASDDTIDGNQTFTVDMNFYKTNGNPSIDETTVGAVWLSYTTPTSAGVTLNCRAK